MLSALAPLTERIGLVATATTTFDEPYLLARRFASLDHISNGRAGWNVVTTGYEGDALNFSRSAHVAKDVRYERARECVEVVRGLWDSWAEDAFPQDRKSGRYLDADKVHVLDHAGKHFQVKGPLNVARSPQGRPVIFHAGQSEAGLELAAAYADCVFITANSKERARELSSGIRDRAAKYGRPPESLKILNGATIYPGRSRAEAEELVAELGNLMPTDILIGNLSKLLATDMSQYDADGPMPVLAEDIVGTSASRKSINDLIRREPLTVREVAQRYSMSPSSQTFVGSATDIADQMEDWYRSGASDGFLVSPAVMPGSLALFVEEVVPELQRRNLFRRDYPGKTLRDIIGVPTPLNPHFA